MKRFARWLLNALTALSLLLCVATVALWVRSYFFMDFGRLVATDRYNSTFFSAGGDITIACDRWPGTYRDYTHHVRSSPLRFHTGIGSGIDNSKHNHPFARFGFAYEADVVMWNGRHLGRNWYFPHWSLCLVFAVLPAWWLRRWRQNRRLAGVGRCRHCHYNLTGNVSGACPECGTAVAEGEA